MQKYDIKILNVSLDPETDDPRSKVAGRFLDYAHLVQTYIILSFGNQNKTFSPASNITIISIRRSNKVINFFRIGIFALRLIRKDNYDLITVPDAYFIGLLFFFIARFSNIAFEIQVHGFEKFWGLRKMIAVFILSRADSVRTVSRRLKEDLIKIFKVEEERITVVAIFVEMVFHPRIASFLKNNGSFVFLTIGRLVPIKNISLQIKAFTEVVKTHKAELWIVGDGIERKKLAKLVENLGQQENITFFGKKKELVQFYKDADVFLLTSEKEGWPLVIIEALSFGLPIIMTSVGQAGEILFDNENALIIPKNDEKTLVSLMRRIIEDNNLRNKLSERSEKTFKNLPKKEEILRQYVISWKRAIDNAKK